MISNEIKELENIRVVFKDGKTLFCGIDVAGYLKYFDANYAVMEYCENIEHINMHHTFGFGQRFGDENFISVEDVRRLMVNSNSFKRAVLLAAELNGVIIPTVGKMIGYSHNLDCYTVNDIGAEWLKDAGIRDEEYKKREKELAETFASIE